MESLKEAVKDRHRLIYTLILWSGYLILGLSINIFGPTLLDLAEQVDTSLFKVSLVLTFRAVGYCFGSMWAGFSNMNFVMVTGVMFSFGTIATVAVAFLDDVWQLWIDFLILGICLGFFEAGSNVFLLFIWGREALPFSQFMHLMFGVGSLMAPIISQPFLTDPEIAEKILCNTSAFHGANDSCTHKSVVHIIHRPEESQLIFPYSIVASILMINAIFYLIVWIKVPLISEHPSRIQDDEDKIGLEAEAEMSSRKRWKVAVVCLTLVFMACDLSLETVFPAYVPTYVVHSDLRMSKQTGVHMVTVYYLCFTFALIPSAFFSGYFGNEITISTCLTVNTITGLMLVVFGSKYATVVWIGVALVGSSMTSLYGCLFGYLEDFFPMSNLVGALMVMFGLIGESLVSLIISHFIEANPRIHMWFAFLAPVCMAVTFIIIRSICVTKLSVKK